MVEIILAIIFLPFGGFFLYAGFRYILAGSINRAIVYTFLGLVLLFLTGLIIYACLRRRNEVRKMNEMETGTDFIVDFFSELLAKIKDFFRRKIKEKKRQVKRK